MNEYLLGIERLDSYLVIGVIIFFGLLEAISGALEHSNRTKDDWIQEVLSFIVLSVVIKPGIVLVMIWIGGIVLPLQEGIMLGWTLWLTAPMFLLVDDFLQYWYHRKAHETDWLWKLHRSHHQAEEMGFFIAYRNAALYYLIMPNIWWIGLLTFLGAGKAIALGIVLKQIVIIGSHSPTKWDQFFYKRPSLEPIIRILERIIITPAFHFSHHGKSTRDNVSDPNGNFGNMFSFWDQMFGTATFTRAYPEELGLDRPTDDSWAAAYLYPAVTSADPESELHEDWERRDTREKDPTEMTLPAGDYLWCSCGNSSKQPFCDGSHHGTKFKPVKFTLEKEKKVRLCNCKLSKRGPFCDFSHIGFVKQE